SNLFKKIIRIIYSCDISLEANIAPSVRFGHGGLGIVVHKDAVIGKNTIIMQHVTIGGNMSKKKKYHGNEISAPIIGENVFIGVGASILGPVVIENNAKIGAGAVVLDDILENGVV